MSEHYPGLDSDLLGHLAEDAGLTDAQLREELPADVPAPDHESGHLARDANMTDEAFRREAGTDDPPGSVGFASSSPG
ncbi:MAG: hypothetical protein H0U41_09755 [Actinobacteria bacterium]|jgi:hypothetical protein|nr:hypothetical protein [Actinomycetota bacterium]